ncbi:MAG: hypothetical protein KDD50_14765 [Bdellovibrionales bacterium]|nr:hypothetical protein [Bdellovibrionales bacterium]
MATRSYTNTKKTPIRYAPLLAFLLCLGCSSHQIESDQLIEDPHTGAVSSAQLNEIENDSKNKSLESIKDHSQPGLHLLSTQKCRESSLVEQPDIFSYLVSNIITHSLFKNSECEKNIYYYHLRFKLICDSLGDLAIPIPVKNKKVQWSIARRWKGTATSNLEGMVDLYFKSDFKIRGNQIRIQKEKISPDYQMLILKGCS